MLNPRTRIEYTSVDDFVVVGVHTIRPVLLRALLAAPTAALAAAFLLALSQTKGHLLDSLWLCAFTAVCVFLTLQTMTVPRPRVAPSSKEFASLPGYRKAVIVHMLELQGLLDAADEAIPLPRQTRRRVDAVVRQTQYVATLLLLAARAEAPPTDQSWWERAQLDDVETLLLALSEQDSKLIRLRADVRAELRSTAVEQPA